MNLLYEIYYVTQWNAFGKLKMKITELPVYEFVKVLEVDDENDWLMDFSSFKLKQYFLNVKNFKFLSLINKAMLNLLLV